MTARPFVDVYKLDGSKDSQVPTPAVLTAPIRPDLVNFVFTNMNKNHRQAYAVDPKAGMRHSAESWGTGRAVARIPRVGGGGTQRSGQGAFGNMCRKGRMFAPTKVWRRWHRKVNINQKRFAISSALAASAIPALVMARGHKIDAIPEVPLVLSDDFGTISKTSAAVKTLGALGVDAELVKSKSSKKIRAGTGKMRNRRYVLRKGPLVIYGNDADSVPRAVRNLPGVEYAHVDRLNLLQLAPGGHLGRFCIWTKSAFEKLDAIYGTYTAKSMTKSDYILPRSSMTNADITRIINSDEVQSALRDPVAPKELLPRKANPLKNLKAMMRLNPYVAEFKKAEEERKRKAAPIAKNVAKVRKEKGRAFFEMAATNGKIGLPN